MPLPSPHLRFPCRAENRKLGLASLVNLLAAMVVMLIFTSVNPCKFQARFDVLGHESRVRGVAISPSGEEVASASGDHSAKVRTHTSSSSSLLSSLELSGTRVYAPYIRALHGTAS